MLVLALLAALAAATPAAKAQTPPRSLKTIPVPRPSNMWGVVQNEAAAIRLGKALFWDMQAGSDGVQACATCHFHAGADSRAKGQLGPGLNHGSSTFEVAGPNATVSASKFPFHRLSDPDRRDSTVLFDSDDVMSSQGVFRTDFIDIVPGSAVERCTLVPDPIFNVGGINVRRVEPRNTPTTINSVFNFRNFWDGRASFFFNGANPVGPRDPSARVLEIQADGSLQPVPIALDHASLASQAAGPPGSPFEMSCGGRTFPKIGKKLLSLPPLTRQLVDPADSVLGQLSRSLGNPGTPGIATTYADMIRAAFDRKYWDSAKVVTFSAGVPTISDPTGSPLTTDQFTVMEANFALFWSMAIQLYEAKLVSDDSRFDRFREGDLGALTAQEQQGLSIFLTQGRCILCHKGPEFTGASVSALGLPAPAIPGHPPVLEGLIERMQMQLGLNLTTASFTSGAVGHPPTLPLAFDPRGMSVEIKQGSALVFSGTFPGTPGSCAAGVTDFFLFPEPGVSPFAFSLASLSVFTGCSREFALSLENLPLGTYTLAVGGVDRGTIIVTGAPGGSVGEILFSSTIMADGLPLDFEPRGAQLTLTQGLSCQDPVAFSGTFPGTAPPACDPRILVDAGRLFSAVLDLVPSGGLDLGPFPFATTSFSVKDDCSARFLLQVFSMPPGPYTFCVDGVPHGGVTSIGDAFYDNGFYNIAVRPTGDDVGVGGEAPAGAPIAFARRVQLGLDVPESHSGIPALPQIGPTDRIAVDGSFKTPSLRNVELTGPYMHNGGFGTLDQVVDFYTRGTDFAVANIDNLDPEVDGISALRGDPVKKAALVAFLKSLTDDRVRFEEAPFDHPQLFVPNGHPGTTTSVVNDGTGRATDQLLEVPAVGASGRCTGIDGTPRPCPAGTIEADVKVILSSSTTNFGATTTLEVDADTAKQVFLRVTVNGIASRPVGRARLRLQVATGSGSDSDSGGRIHATNCNWDEMTMTWNTRASIDGPVLSLAGGVGLGQSVEFDVTPAIFDDGVYCFALDSLSANNVKYNSREAATGRPQLLLDLQGSVVAACGDNRINQASEQCDGTDTGACAFGCARNCLCQPPPACGDGVINQASEQCDGLARGACIGGCQADCTCIPACGDGAINQVSEQCDGAAAGICRSGCRADCTCVPGCGDGAINRPNEQCDGAATGACLGGCQTDCTCAPVCGDGLVNQGGESCDGADRGVCLGACQANCTCAPACGDQVINQGSEQCDGAETGTCAFGCQANCTCAPAPVCGDGIVNQASEQCDGAANAVCPGGCQANCTCVASSSSVTAAVVADTAVRVVSPTSNFGGSSGLDIDADSAKLTFLRINVSGIGTRSVASAKLRLFVPNSSGNESVQGGRIHTMSAVNCAWDERTVTWDTRPAIDGPVLSSLGAVGLGQTVEFDITSAVHDGTFCLGIDSTSSDNVRYASREAASGKPVVVITLAGAAAPRCGDGLVNQAGEQCDGSANAACPGGCQANCTCAAAAPRCGDGLVNQASEQCDGSANATCPGGCQADCTCTAPAGTPTGIVEADVTANANSPTTNFGGGPTLIADASTLKQTFFRVRVSGVGASHVTSAVLRLNATLASPSGGRIHAIPECGSWSETGLTFNARPASAIPTVSTPVLSSAGAVTVGQSVDFALTPAITGDGVYCFVLDSLNSSEVRYGSREAATGKPTLVVQVAP